MCKTSEGEGGKNLFWNYSCDRSPRLLLPLSKVRGGGLNYKQ